MKLFDTCRSTNARTRYARVDVRVFDDAPITSVGLSLVPPPTTASEQMVRGKDGFFCFFGRVRLALALSVVFGVGTPCGKSNGK